MTSYQELLAKKSALEKQAAELEKLLQDARKAERDGVISQIRQLMIQNGLTLEDLGVKGTVVKTRTSSNLGRAVAPKYRDPSTGDTWTGRGLKPKWVTAALSSGKSLDDLKI